MTRIHNGRPGRPTPLVLILVAGFALACGRKKGPLDASMDSGGAPGGMVGSPDAGAGASAGGAAGGAGQGGAAGGGGQGGAAGGGGGDAAGAGGTAGASGAGGGDTTSGPDAGQSDDGGTDAGSTFSCSPNQPDGGWNWDGPPPPSTECVRGQQYCDNAKCYDLARVNCAGQPTCLCVDRGYVNCHCSEDGHGAVWHLGCDPI